jgi:hypothetical protein
MGHALPLGALFVIALVTAMLVVAVGGALYQREIGMWYRRLVQWVSPPIEPPAGPPIERIARDVRRLRAQVMATTPGTPMAKRVGAWQAYDDRLCDACRALGVTDTLTAVPPGTERDAERLLVEDALGKAGLRFSA